MSNPIPPEAGFWLDEYDSERFWRSVNVHGGTDYLLDGLARLNESAGECWVWTGKRDKPKDDSRAYGSVALYGRTVPAHVVGFRDLGGSIPAGHQLDHLCRNRLCVRRAHLEAVTPPENVGRGKSGRDAHPTCAQGHQWTEESTYWRTSRGRRWRVCRPCKTAQKRAARAKP